MSAHRGGGGGGRGWSCETHVMLTCVFAGRILMINAYKLLQSLKGDSKLMCFLAESRDDNLTCFCTENDVNSHAFVQKMMLTHVSLNRR